jgi:hypothetical protein
MCDKRRAKTLSKTLTRPDREGPLQFFEVKKLDWAQNFLRIMHKLSHVLTQLDCPGSWHELTSRPD